MQVYKDFLKRKHFAAISELLLSPRFPWFWNDEINYPGKGETGFQFVYTFMRNDEQACSDKVFDIIEPVIDLLKPKSIRRIKANLSPRDCKNTVAGMHTDSNYNESTHSAVFYINTCNGYTLFETGEKEMSEANKIVVFPSWIPHSSVTATDEKRRVVLNLNYTV